METKLAKTAGFCYGVSRAVDIACSALEQKGKLYTFGPVVHNPSVTSELERRGAHIISDIGELEEMCRNGSLSGSTVLLRAHGVPLTVTRLLEEYSVDYIDATCPHVKKIHEIVRREKAAGHDIIIIGDPEHPEVTGILGQIGGGACVINSVEEAQKYETDPARHITVVSQTTMSIQKFQLLVEILKKKSYYVVVVNTICNATQMRQKETSELARSCDAMIVIGGRDSSNTRKLYDICRSFCKATYYVQSVGDLEGMLDRTVRCVGITAGASTPKSIIEEVQKYVRDEL